MEHYDFHNNSEENALKCYEMLKCEKYIVIYGASLTGIALKNALETLSIPITFFWDRNKNTKIEGYEVKETNVTEPDEIFRKNALIIVAMSLLDDFIVVYNILVKNGYTRIMWGADQLKLIKSINCYLNGSGIMSCKKCSFLDYDCLCAKDNFLGITTSENKLNNITTLTIKYDNEYQLENTMTSCRKFLSLYNFVPRVIINYTNIENISLLIRLFSDLLSFDNVGIVYIIIRENSIFNNKIIELLKENSNKLHIILLEQTIQFKHLLIDSNLSFEKSDNTRFESNKESEYNFECLNSQCKSCIYSRVMHHKKFCITDGGILGYKCPKLVEFYKANSTSGDLSLIDLNILTSEEIKDSIIDISSINYYFDSCDDRISNIIHEL